MMVVMANDMKATPRIANLEWGRIDTEGASSSTFKDAKLFPGGARAWDWRETGTQHVPGIQIADAEELLDAGADVVVLSRGMDLVLLVPAETIAALEALGVEVHVAQTKEAVRIVNELVKHGRKVGALLHSTC
jgi:hypothetical protein